MSTTTKVKEKSAPAPASKNGFSLISNDKLRLLYSTMLKCRALEERISLLAKQDRFKGDYLPAMGREASEVGVAVDLRAGDAIAPPRRDLIASLIKGVPLNAMLSQLYANSTSPNKGRSSPAYGGHAPLNVIPPSTTSAAQSNIAAGVALAYKLQKNKNVVVAFSGGGSKSLALWREALNFAGAQQLPILFVVQNKHRAKSISVKKSKRLPDPSVQAEAFGIPGIPVDGNDVVAVYRVAFEAIARARQGGGPTLIECKTYRWNGHSEIDSARYRDPEEAAHQRSRDPIHLMEQYLTRKGLFTSEWKQSVLDDFQGELDEAIKFADAVPSIAGRKSRRKT
jgi:TPP-dependent pyruvate/acetoin dehydrogenase alpha subunit